MSEWKPQFLVPCHCTGVNAAEQMSSALGGNIVSQGCAGMVISAGSLSG
jgi:metal-dependent hydrolase (beta-lactamase superfamily II)